jgi:hypothetical protein
MGKRHVIGVANLMMRVLAGSHPMISMMYNEHDLNHSFDS